MHFLKSSFFRKLSPSKKQAPTIEMPLSSTFARDVEKAICLLSNGDGSNSNEEVLTLFIDNGIKRREAGEILLFLPIVFVRLLLPQFDWPDSFYEPITGQQNEYVTKRYDEVPSFRIISQVANAYFENKPEKDTILKIAGRSAEFHSINNLLLKGLKLDEIKVTLSVVMREPI
ncbi:hypothetical protein KTO58_26575 [Chitinophaga pendula]|uniref:hypothetical protein n=1 Tax=Chitinophaga TaxID=79328 RepID=UPI000BB04282|nr:MULTISPECIES: hypothetical protein [Chitinophaga]ASZ09871.1 hypothetical protein CK934_02190 [Chitinophaga sp. MD30]UCJ07187.1 hypothetical protein KTO58_26575 [Chitinophaga pendula]